MNTVTESPLVLTLRKEFAKARSRGWEKFYVTVDLHDTVLGSSYDASDISRNFYPGAIAFLQYLSSRKDVVLILCTSSRISDIEKYQEMFKELNIRFHYVNENPDHKSTAYADFEKKYYMNLILDDKAGFNPETDFAPLLAEFKKTPQLSGPKRTFEVAATVMRIQSPIGPHEGHMVVLKEMFERGKKVIIYLGCDKVFVSQKNPLGFDERKILLEQKIIEAGFGDRIYSILPMFGRRENAVWSHDLDSNIKSHLQRPDFDADQVGLFHSREGFGPYYFPHGMFPLVEVEEVPGINATAIRSKSGTHRTVTPDYVAGMVAQEMKHPRKTFQVQTRVVVKNEEGRYGLIKYQSTDETKYRFVGGYFSPEKDGSFGGSAERKLYAKLDYRSRSAFKFLDEVQIKDWRYRESGAKIMCIAYEATIEGEVTFKPTPPGARIIDLIFVSREQLKDYVDEEEASIIPLIK